ncbi:MAG TPA: prepilin-type N-terminal cleavage/methylation domain-containing protein [Deltaproteobacteria bacterium]|nr:prepilin-type N-terminal cleavage/methylation domain-containing protein [Deltaproteobacteria bacterium]
MSVAGRDLPDGVAPALRRKTSGVLGAAPLPPAPAWPPRPGRAGAAGAALSRRKGPFGGAGGRGRRRPGEGGFTLLETLIALALTALVLTALYGTFFIAVRAGDGAAMTGLDAYLQAGRLTDRFCRDVASAVFRPADGATFFTGRKRDVASTVSFTTFGYPTPLSAAPVSDLTAVSYFVDDGPDGASLYREVWSPYVKKKFRVEMVRGVRAFEVTFYNGLAWSKAWDASLEKALPRAVKMRLVLGDMTEVSAVARTRIR